MLILKLFVFINLVNLIFYYLLDKRSRKEFGISIVLINFIWSLTITLIWIIYNINEIF
jgi:hypothetical protein